MENPEATVQNTADEKTASSLYDSLKRKQKHYENMRWEISRLVDCNFDDDTKFLTLTFKENILNIRKTNRELKNFIKRLNYFLYKQKKQTLKYIATWERQKRGAIHYHIILFDFPYIRMTDLQKVWGHGFVKINKVDVDSIENRGRYISKYFSKELELRDHKQKAFFTSQNLKKPLVKRLILTDEQMKALKHENVLYMKEYNRVKYIAPVSEMDTGTSFEDSLVTYIKIKK